eukprot:TRINITY_DN12698_c0_g1_i1.p3 TRINITY_DN12698_c0_g1~~TRINITY_DN12698_c0_g1_i1.p3  ORF type:complete len:115 (-),score=1.87 TRINITY_DN12698_c0_g1_i1:146-490(-)
MDTAAVWPGKCSGVPCHWRNAAVNVKLQISCSNSGGTRKTLQARKVFINNALGLGNISFTRIHSSNWTTEGTCWSDSMISGTHTSTSLVVKAILLLLLFAGCELRIYVHMYSAQ